MANRAQLYKYRGNRCAQCGMPVDEMVRRYSTFNRMLEFHHINPGTKHFDYNNLINKNISSEQIEEVDKCVLLCRQCHGIVHAQNINGEIEVKLKLKDRTVTQKLKGWFVVDDIDKTITFITNENLLLQPCIVKLGGEQEQKYCILELEQKNRLLNWLQDIEVYKAIEIWSLNKGKMLLQVRHQAGRRINVRMSLGFPVIAMDFNVEEGDSDYLWLRNGMVLTKEGDVITDGVINFPVDLTI